jgi:hypothetical protein
MTNGDVRPQDLSNQAQKTSSNDTTSSAQDLDQDNHEEDIDQMIKAKKRAMIKEEMRMMG